MITKLREYQLDIIFSRFYSVNEGFDKKRATHKRGSCNSAIFQDQPVIVQYMKYLYPRGLEKKPDTLLLIM